jgi:hypothetical protein
MDLYDPDWELPYQSKLEKAFWDFHRAYPEVYKTLVYHAREWKKAGYDHLGIKTLFERARWTINLAKQNDGMKLNNNHTAFYARLIEAQEHDLHGFFRFRQQRIQASFGPDNNGLPPGDHIA